MARAKMKHEARLAYAVEEIIDAPEHHDYARAMGLLTWGTWEPIARPVEARRGDFAQAYPPSAPSAFQGSVLEKDSRGEYGPAPAAKRLARFVDGDGAFGSLAEVLARYGLKLRYGPAYVPKAVEVPAFRDVALLRNQRLRTLYGAVDLQAQDMDAAKAAELDRLEKKRAAEEIRKARERMRENPPTINHN